MLTLLDIGFVVAAPGEAIQYLNIEYHHEQHAVYFRTADIRLIGKYSLAELGRLVDLHCRRRPPGKYIRLAFSMKYRPYESEDVDLPVAPIKTAVEILSKIVALFSS